MARFLNTNKLDVEIEELMKKASSELVLFSPYLQLNDRLRLYLESKQEENVRIMLVYGKNKDRLSEKETLWLANQKKIAVYFCKTLHAKMYKNEEKCILTSMNLYDYSMKHNDETGVLLSYQEDPEAFNEAAEEASFILQKSQIVSFYEGEEEDPGYPKLTTGKLAEKYGLSLANMKKRLVTKGYLENVQGSLQLTSQGKEAGGEFKYNAFKKYSYFLWPREINV